MKSTIPLLAMAAFLAIPANGLACTSRPKTSPPRPIIKIVCLTPTTYRIYISGYLTVGGTAATFCACGLGLPARQVVITGVTRVSLIDNSTGLPLTATGTTLFPFVPSANASRAWQSLMGASVSSSGFLATVAASRTRPIPANVCVCFCFTITVRTGATAAQVAQTLAAARIGGDEANSNGTLKRSHLTLVTAGGAAASCILYYKMDRALGATRINYDGAGVAPPTGTVNKAPAAFVSSAPGKFGRALRGTRNTTAAEYNFVDTGWRGGIAGGFTVHWWMKQRVAPGTALSYTWGGIGNFRCFTNGVAGTTLWVRAWNSGSTFNIILPTVGSNIQVLARRTRGVSVALTVNATTDRAQWYVDGAPKGGAIVLPAATAGLLVAASTRSFKIGKHTSNTRSSSYDIDEFKLCNRVASAAEIKAWHAATWAASAPYGRPWGLWHDSLNGPPRLGNSRYALTFNGPPRGRILFVLGVREVPEFDMGGLFGVQRCLWYTDFLIQALLPLDASGALVLPLPIPNVTSNIGLAIDTQALGIGPTGAGGILISNAVSTRIERN